VNVLANVTFKELFSMPRKQLTIALVCLALVAGAVIAFEYLPKDYTTGERMNEATIFWHDGEAFIFLELGTTGKAENVLQAKMASTRYFYLLPLLGRGPRFYDSRFEVYRLEPAGGIALLDVPTSSGTVGTWTLENGKLQLTPLTNNRRHRDGFRWDGTRFVTVSPVVAQPVSSGNTTSSTLSPDDVADDDDSDSGIVARSARAAFKKGGWHYKILTGYETPGNQATLPISLGKSSFNLGVTTFPRKTGEFSPGFDLLTLGVQTLALSPASGNGQARTLWTQRGWQTISKAEFERRAFVSGLPTGGSRLALLWLAVVLFAVLLKFGAWGHLILNLFNTKRRVLKNMATSYSFPPATPAQFPQLDLAEMERYTRELEALGFVQLMDLSLVSDAANSIPVFSRLFTHTRHHCFAETGQIFPRGKAPMAYKCSLQSCLSDSWTLTFTDRKPLPGGILLRRGKAMSVAMPDATLSELLNAFLQMRGEVCQDLGISVMNDDSKEAYFAKVQRTCSEIREAVSGKNFAKGIPQFYWRKFSLLKTKSEYVWLGDYPKEAERRRQGVISPARALG
jgi:hypothetical protein